MHGCCWGPRAQGNDRLRLLWLPRWNVRSSLTSVVEFVPHVYVYSGDGFRMFITSSPRGL